MNLGLSTINLQNSFVTGSELAQLSREILGEAPEKLQKAAEKRSLTSTSATPSYEEVSPITSETSRQIAAVKSGYQVDLSQKAIKDIQALNLKAAQTVNPFSSVDGKVHFQAPVSNAESLKKETLDISKDLLTIETEGLAKDKKGSNGAMVFKKKSKAIEEQVKGISIFA